MATPEELAKEYSNKIDISHIERLLYRDAFKCGYEEGEKSARERILWLEGLLHELEDRMNAMKNL